MLHIVVLITVYGRFFNFILYNVRYSPRNHKIALKECFSIFMGFQNTNENGFHGIGNL